MSGAAVEIYAPVAIIVDHVVVNPTVAPESRNPARRVIVDDVTGYFTGIDRPRVRIQMDSVA